MLDEPDLFPDNAETFSAFFLLSNGRPAGVTGVAAIPLSEIASWCDIAEVEDRVDFCRQIRAMDTAFIKFMKDQAS